MEFAAAIDTSPISSTDLYLSIKKPMKRTDEEKKGNFFD